LTKLSDKLTKDGKSFPAVLESKGIEVGIKVDQGLVDFLASTGELGEKLPPDWKDSRVD